MQHLAPKGQPRGTGSLRKLLQRQIGVNDRLDSRSRCADEPQPRPDMMFHSSRQGAKSRVQQTVLVAEIMRHQAGRDPRAARDLGERRADESQFG